MSFEPTDDVTAWRKSREPVTITLGCGLRIQARRANLIDLVKGGKIPIPLAARAEAMIFNERPTIDPESMAAQVPIVNLVCHTAIVSPALAPLPLPGTGDEPELLAHPAAAGVKNKADLLDLEELPYLDRVSLYNWAQGEVASFAPFSAGRDDGADD